MNQVLEQLAGKLIVSCQAYPGEPMRHPETMRRVAQAAAAGGAAGIRAQGLDDLREIRQHVALPLIGLWKDGSEGVFITPTVSHATAVAETGCDIVAIDATDRPRPDSSAVADSVSAVHALGALVMADCSSLQDALAAQAAGADCVGTTLAGYTPAREKTRGPDFALLKDLVAALDIPVICEGRIHSPQEASEAMALGASSVVVGTAITHPSTIVGWYADAVSSPSA